MKVSSLVDIGSAAVVGLAILASGAVLARFRRRDVALPVLLDFLSAAGLLHLAADPNFMRAASAAAVLAVRRLALWSLAGRVRGVRAR